jgi:hypothetical protein
MTATNGCRTPNKKAFLTRRDAERAIKRKKKWLRVYECRCGAWHMTSRRHARKAV